MPDLNRGDFRKAVLLEPRRPSVMVRGEIGASAAAYPNGLLSQRIGRWIVRQARRLMRRDAPK